LAKPKDLEIVLTPADMEQNHPEKPVAGPEDTKQKEQLEAMIKIISKPKEVKP